jgi:Ribonuclease G/E
VTQRRYFLDQGFGECRAVVTVDGKPERLIISRHNDPPAQTLGARVVGRIRAVERAQAIAFVDLGVGPDGVLNITAETVPLVEGGWFEVEVKSEARRGKGPTVRVLCPATGPGRVLAAGHSPEQLVSGFARGARIEQGGEARAVADRAQEEALERDFGLPGGGSIAVEATRALTAVDVDVGDRSGQSSKRTTRAANMAALAEAARVLRLKGLGGLIVIDLAGRGHDAPALLAAARTAFAPDNPGVTLGPVSRFGTLELLVPRRARPTLEILLDASGAPTAPTSAMALVRAVERETGLDRGGRFEVLTSPNIAEAAEAGLAMLIERVGSRVTLRIDPKQVGFEIFPR